jgi:hypothetical protein
MSEGLSESLNPQHDHRLTERSDVYRASPFQQWSALANAYWRGKINRWIKDSIISRTLGSIFLGLFVLVSILWFGLSTAIGFALANRPENASNFANLAIWNGLSVMFLIFWMVSLFNDAVRGDTLSLQRLMHLPISPASVFAFNYLLSWINIPLIFFLASGTGLVFGSSLAIGPTVLWKWIPVLSFAAMISALTSHIQGKLLVWLVNPRSRTWIMTLMPLLLAFMGFGIAIGSHYVKRMVDAPSFVYWLRVCDAACPFFWVADVLSNKSLLGDWSVIWIPCMWLITAWSLRANYRLTRTYYQDGFEVASNPSGNPTSMGKQKASNADFTQGNLAWMERSFPGLSGPASAIAAMTWTMFWRSPQMKLAMIIPLIQPFIFLGLFSQRPSLQRDVPPPPAVSSLASPEQTTSNPTTNPTTVRPAEPTAEPAIVPTSVEPSAELTEVPIEAPTAAPIEVPPAAPIEVPHAKSAGPLARSILTRLSDTLGGKSLQGPYLFSFAVFSAFMGSTFASNIFGFDRSGFRFWVLSPLPRVEILRGRNWIFGLMVLTITVVTSAFAAGMWRYHWLREIEAIGASLAFVPIYMILTNLISILAPFPMSPQGFQPKSFSWKTLVLNFALSALIPALMIACCTPWALEWGLHATTPATKSLPIALILQPILILASFWLYGRLLTVMAELLEYRELDLLKTVTSSVEN